MPTRTQIYTLLIVISAGLMLGRIIAVNRTDTLLFQQSRFSAVNTTYNERAAQLEGQLRESEGLSEEEIEKRLAELEERRQQALENERRELPVFSANDRSRWATIRVLVEPDMRVQRTVELPDGTSRIETVWYAIDKAQNVRGWDTIDMVKHDLPDQPGVGFGCPDECKICAARPEEEESKCGYLYSSKPPLLPTLMAIPYYVMYTASRGKISLAEHPHLVVRVTLVVCNLIPLMICWFLLARLIERFGMTDWGRIFCVAFLCFGTFISTFAVTLNNHLPGVVCVAVAFYFAVRIVYDGKTQWRYYAAAGFFAAFAVACELPALLFCCLTALWLFVHYWKGAFSAAPGTAEDSKEESGAAVHTLPSAVCRPSSAAGLIIFTLVALLVAGAYFGANYFAHKTLLPAYAKKYGDDSWYLYEYERGGRVLQSHWTNPKDLDAGEPCPATYVFHSAIGHHGLFSLTPVWALSFLGLGIWLFDRRYRTMSAIILLTGIVVFTFYMQQPLHERNYGGNTSALRWMFWLAPLWSVALVAAADWLSRNAFFRAVALLCLAASVMSAAYPIWNPWTMPWTFNLLEYVR